jgi:2-aminoadipate transaminase
MFLNTMQDNFPEDMGVIWTKPHGGLFTWATVPERINTLALFYEAIKFKVAFVPGEVFYGESPAKNHMKINFSAPSKSQLAEAVKRLSDCLKNQL